MHFASREASSVVLLVRQEVNSIKMRFRMHTSILAFCCIACVSISSTFACTVDGIRLYCGRDELSMENPINAEREIYEGRPTEANLTVEQIDLYDVTGSIGIKTFSSFPEATELEIRYPNFTAIEKGTLCSFQKLKILKLVDYDYPIFTKEDLKGCNHVEEFECEVPLTEDALEEMTGLKTLKLGTRIKYNKTNLASLKQLKSLSMHIDTLDGAEAGFLCAQPTVEDLNVEVMGNDTLEITESLFDGCNILKFIRIRGKAVVPDGQYPFSNKKHLKEIIISAPITKHLTKKFLEGLPNLKELSLAGSSNSKLIIDTDTFEGAPGIIGLRLAYDSLVDSDLEALHVLTQLKKLELEHNEIKDLNAIPELPKLEALYIPYNNITKFDFAAFKKKVPNLKWLLMMDNPFDPAFEEELSSENDILIRTSYNGITNRNESVHALLEQYPIVISY